MTAFIRAITVLAVLLALVLWAVMVSGEWGLT
jgi:hypothetical protein